MFWSPRWRKRFREGSLAVLGVTAIGLAVWWALQQPQERPIHLSMTAGQEGGTRHKIAQELQLEAARRGLFIDVRPMTGSQQALRALETGEVDFAMVQGGLEMGDSPVVRQVASLHVEPLHLLVKEELHRGVARQLAALRGKVINLGEPGSGSLLLATEVLEFAGLNSDRDFIVSDLSYSDLERETDRSRLPDAVFTVSSLPSTIVRHLVNKQDYRLVPLPFFEAFALGAIHRKESPPRHGGRTEIRIDRRHVYDTTIPAFVYEVEPGVPPELIHTLGTRLLVVVRTDVSADTIQRLLEVVFNSPFAQVIQPPLDARLLEVQPEFPWHDGTIRFVRRNSPLIAGDVIDLLEKEVSIIGVLAGGILCLVQWLRRRTRWRRKRSFEAYILKVAEVERRALALSRQPALDLPRLLQLQEELIGIKGEALQRFADGELDGEELMSGFLTHVSDARDFLVRLILHQRDNLEDLARTQQREPAALWAEAVDVHHRGAAICPELDGVARTADSELSLRPVVQHLQSDGRESTAPASDIEVQRLSARPWESGTDYTTRAPGMAAPIAAPENPGAARHGEDATRSIHRG
jgi:TRAP-type uncharacterized transport system substrate-binding protein